MSKRVTRKKTNSHVRMRLFVFLPLFIFSFIFLSYSCGNNIIKLIELRSEKKNLEKKLVALSDEKEDLEADVKRLSDSNYIARYAREKYLYSKEGEIIIRIDDDE